MKQTINIRQCGIILIMCIFANKLLLMPSLLYTNVKADGIFVTAILFLIELAIIPLIFLLKKHFPKQSLYEILKSRTGVIFTKLIYMLLLIFFLFKIILVFSITYVYFKQQIYKDEIIWIALISILPVINHSVANGIRPLARTMEIFFALVLIGFLACLGFSLFTNIELPYMFLSDIQSFFGTMYKHLFSFGDVIFLFLILDKIEIKEGEEKKLYHYAILGFILIIMLYFLYYGKYQVTSFMHNNALADILVFSVQFNAIGRLDIIAMITILFITIFQLEIFSYGFSDCFLHIFPKLNNIYSIIVFDITFLILYYFFLGKYEIMINSTLTWLPVLAVIINVIFPLILFVIYLVKRSKNEETD